MKINGMQVAPVEDKKTRGQSKAAGKGIPQPFADESEQPRKKSSILMMIIILLVVALILAGLVFFAFKMRPSGKATMSATTSQTTKSKGKNEPSGSDAVSVSGGVLSNAVSVQGVSVEDDSLGYNISVVSYIPGYKASDGSTVMLVKYKAKPVGSVYSLVDTSALKLKINDKVISSSSDYNTDMSKLNLGVFESTEASQEVDGWLAYPYNGDPTGIAFFYDRGTVSVDASSDSEGVVKPEMKKEIPLPSGK